MTSISSISSDSYRRYLTTTSTSTSDGSDSIASILSSDTDSSSKSQASTASDSDYSSSAEKLISQLMSMILNLQGGGATDDNSSEANSRQDMVSAMDTDGDGNVTEAEFVAARPSDVSEDQAASLFSSFDVEGVGSLSTEELTQHMQRPSEPPPPPPMPDDSDLSDAFSSLDTDGDGSISEAEFVAARPADLSEEDASTLFESLDTSGSGSLTEDQFTSAVRAAMARPADMFGYPDAYSDNMAAEILSL